MCLQKSVGHICSPSHTLHRVFKMIPRELSCRSTAAPTHYAKDSGSLNFTANVHNASTDVEIQNGKNTVVAGQVFTACTLGTLTNGVATRENSRETSKGPSRAPLREKVHAYSWRTMNVTPSHLLIFNNIPQILTERCSRSNQTRFAGRAQHDGFNRRSSE